MRGGAVLALLFFLAALIDERHALGGGHRIEGLLARLDRNRQQVARDHSSSAAHAHRVETSASHASQIAALQSKRKCIRKRPQGSSPTANSLVSYDRGEQAHASTSSEQQGRQDCPVMDPSQALLLSNRNDIKRLTITIDPNPSRLARSFYLPDSSSSSSSSSSSLAPISSSLPSASFPSSPLSTPSASSSSSRSHTFQSAPLSLSSLASHSSSLSSHPSSSSSESAETFQSSKLGVEKELEHDAVHELKKLAGEALHGVENHLPPELRKLAGEAFHAAKNEAEHLADKLTDKAAALAKRLSPELHLAARAVKDVAQDAEQDAKGLFQKAFH